METQYVSFSGRGGRDGRAKYIAEQFPEYLNGKVLDVGCDTRRLKSLMPELDYVGIDIGGEPDIRINLEEVDRLPFDDRQFQCVTCTDVLEHIDCLHHIFNELVRVCDRHLIISLPNCWNALRSRLARGAGDIQWYGLPPEKPVDRHKWFFNASDIVSFMQDQQQRHPLRVVRFLANVRPGVSNRLRRAVYPPQMRYLNRYSHSVWTILERTD